MLPGQPLDADVPSAAAADVEANATSNNATRDTDPELDGSFFAGRRFGRFSGLHHWLSFAMYIPAGVCLFTMRMLVALVVLLALILPAACCCRKHRGRSAHGCSGHRIIVGFFRSALMSVEVVRRHQTHGSSPVLDAVDARVIVSNHVSEADYLPIASCFDVRVVAMDYIERVPVVGSLLKVVDPIYIGQVGNAQSAKFQPNEAMRYKAAQRERLQAATLESCTEDGDRGSPPAILIFPEGVLTNGHQAVLKYQQFIFSLGLTVQPLAIRRSAPAIQRRFFPVDHDAATASFMTNVLWMFFMPQAHYEITVLPQMTCGAAEAATEFADRVQAATAEALGLLPSRWSNRDKNAYVQEHWIQQP